ncbi:MAG: polyphosphate kinase 2 family protein [Proteobacteria bacterium]|nr:polyphosphate kinase 2 family protein [Pseudomonadota bacterium]
MFNPVSSPYLVAFDGSFRVADAPNKPPGQEESRKSYRKKLKSVVSEMKELQDVLYASDTHALLLVFQAMDAAGKDGTIRAVMSGVNPAGCQVFSFKQPSAEELDHDFLWRTSRCLPERGRIGIFNRSYYEEVLAVRVHPEFLKGQRLPSLPAYFEELWLQRYGAIAEHEKHLANAGTVVLKFWLNVSHAEQRQRFLSRIDEPAKNWKFASGDVRERQLWPKYMEAYQEALRQTSKPWAPWYAIPADNKPYMRLAVADIVARTLKSLGLEYPKLSDKERANLSAMREQLLSED